MASQTFKKVGKLLKRVSMTAVVAFPCAFQAMPARACGVPDQVVSISANGSSAVVMNASGNQEQISPDEAFRRASAAKQAAHTSDDSCGTMASDSIMYLRLYTQMNIYIQQSPINSLRVSMGELPLSAPPPLPGMPAPAP